MWSLLACQSPPSSPTVAIEPAEPTGADTLVAVTLDEAVDPDGDYLTTSWIWYRDDERMGGLTGPEIVPEHTSKGETWEVRVVVSDGYTDADPAVDSVVIGNLPPEVEVSLPELQGSGYDLVATVETSDPDGDEVLVEASWTVDDGDASVTGLEVPALLLETGQTWTILARASDGESWAETTASVLVGNAQPVVTEVVLSPDPATVEDTFTVTAEVEDDDSPTVVYDWYVNNELVVADGGDSLSAEGFEKHDQVAVLVTASDDLQSSEPRSSNVVRIANSPPVAPTLVFTPEEPHAGHDDLVCRIDTEGTDADGDELSYDFGWSVEGVATSADTTTLNPLDTVAGERLVEGESWTCTVEVSDGMDTDEASESVEISWACDASRDWDSASISAATAIAGSTDDVDGDGHADLVICDSDDNVRVFWGDGSGSFGLDDASSNTLGDGSAGVGIGDLSGDGNDDLVTIDSTEGQLVVLVNTGSHTWNRVHADLDDDARDIELADVDLDGRDDVVYTSDTQGCMALRLGRGGSSVGDPTCLISQLGPFELGDLDGDGLAEVVQVAEGDIKVYEFDTGGSGELKVFTVLPSPELDPEDVALDDADGDGDLDVLAWGTWEGEAALALYFNDGDGDPSTSFSECGIGAFDGSPVGAADLDEDGIPDTVLVDGASYEVLLSR